MLSNKRVEVLVKNDYKSSPRVCGNMFCWFHLALNAKYHLPRARVWELGESLFWGVIFIYHLPRAMGTPTVSGLNSDWSDFFVRSFLSGQLLSLKFEQKLILWPVCFL